MKYANLFRLSICISVLFLFLTSCLTQSQDIQVDFLPTITSLSPSPSPTIDPCTGWWCTATGIVYRSTVESSNELEGAIITLDQASSCSPTRGQQETVSGPDGKFEFSELFFHDTDGIRIEVAYEGYEITQWDTKPLGCLHCDCFVMPIEILLQVANDQSN